LGGDGRIHCVSAALQDGGACLRCEGDSEATIRIAKSPSSGLAAVLRECFFVRHARHKKCRSHGSALL